MGFPFQISVEVTFRDLDALGHVNHATYFTYMETARIKFLVMLLGLQGMGELPIIVAEACCQYKAPAHFGEQLTVGLGVSRLGGKSFDLSYDIVAANGRSIATGKTVQVMYDYAQQCTYPIPDELRQKTAVWMVE